MAELRHHQLEVNDIRLHVVEAGPRSGPAVVLAHGFPELWYSWRHQIPALADAGYHVICPDQRGYGDSDRPDRVEDYGIRHLTGDLLGLLDAFGHDDAVFVGHDWGALICWGMARLHPARVTAVCAMSVPLFSPADPPVEHFITSAGSGFYVVAFQEPGYEAAMEANPRETMRWTLTAPPPDTSCADTGETPAGLTPPPETLPEWLTEADLDYYAAAFEKSGFFGGVCYYRNLDDNWRLMKDVPYEAMSMPVLFMSGSLDWVHTSPWGAVAGTELTGVAAMEQVLPDFRGAVFIEGADHWNLEQNAADTNAALLRFLGDVSPVT